MKQIHNPYLPEYEYIPDGEPHVFGDRIYVYGSHDRLHGKKFCLNDYVSYSAPVEDLTDWRYEGVIYKKTQDPRMADGNHELWAPDVVQGPDGRYYLYYCPDDKILSIGVAVCDTPAGQYEFYGIVHDRDGGLIGERPGDTFQFDPGVFVDDDGRIWLFSGNGPRVRRDIGKQPKASVIMELESDMLTVKAGPRKLLPALGEEQGTGFENHEFFEASSIRKIDGRYYMVYSSRNLHELCYATADRPDGPYSFGGVLISNCSSHTGTDKVKPLFPYGNNHGGIEKAGNDWYVFYHRQTDRTMFSRQGCAEKIQILADGRIPEVQMTSQGLNGKPLAGSGIYPASMACLLYRRKKGSALSNPLLMRKRFPYLTSDGEDWSPGDAGEPARQYIANGKNGMIAGFRYFEIKELKKVEVLVRGSGRGRLVLRTSPEGPDCGSFGIRPSKFWHKYSAPVTVPDGVQALFFCYEGRGKIDFLDFRLI